MGFRDDTAALQGHCDVLQRELEDLRGDLDAAVEQRETLEERLRELRWRKRLHRVLLAIFGARKT